METPPQSSESCQFQFGHNQPPQLQSGGHLSANSTMTRSVILSVGLWLTAAASPVDFSRFLPQHLSIILQSSLPQHLQVIFFSSILMGVLTEDLF